MSGLAEHADRATSHRQPRPTSHWSPDKTDLAPHPGPIDRCPICEETP